LLDRSTIASTIDNIPPDAEDHDVERALERWALSHHPAFDANGLARTITCGGGEFNYHPSGTRPYTSREMALLQTFPLNYRFTGKFMRKQVGNAVPPLFAKAIIGEIIRSLKESDADEANGTFY
jgi:DNA (cytosine-5)-methyltransferase 1